MKFSFTFRSATNLFSNVHSRNSSTFLIFRSIPFHFGDEHSVQKDSVDIGAAVFPLDSSKLSPTDGSVNSILKHEFYKT
jgi:hypothetical protein